MRLSLVGGFKVFDRLLQFVGDLIAEGFLIVQAEQLDKLGFDVIPVPFRDVYPFGGALHCNTTDVYREGDCQDYFPKQ